jgi:hypothetical protein
MNVPSNSPLGPDSGPHIRIAQAGFHVLELRLAYMSVRAGWVSNATICAISRPGNAPAVHEIQSDAVAIVPQLLAIHDFPKERGIILQGSHSCYISHLPGPIGNDARPMGAYIIRIRHFRPILGGIQRVSETHNDCNW